MDDLIGIKFLTQIGFQIDFETIHIIGNIIIDFLQNLRMVHTKYN